MSRSGRRAAKPPEQRNGVFKAFFRAESADRAEHARCRVEERPTPSGRPARWASLGRNFSASIPFWTASTLVRGSRKSRIIRSAHRLQDADDAAGRHRAALPQKPNLVPPKRNSGDPPRTGGGGSSWVPSRQGVFDGDVAAEAGGPPGPASGCRPARRDAPRRKRRRADPWPAPQFRITHLADRPRQHRLSGPAPPAGVPARAGPEHVVAEGDDRNPMAASRASTSASPTVCTSAPPSVGFG